MDRDSIRKHWRALYPKDCPVDSADDETLYMEVLGEEFTTENARRVGVWTEFYKDNPEKVETLGKKVERDGHVTVILRVPRKGG